MATTRTYYDERLGLLVVPEGACPYPICDDDGSAKQCVENGHCGCDEFYKLANSESR